MSLINSVANCRKKIGSGISRIVFYSKKYDVVIKRQKYDRKNWNKQSRLECKLFDILDESDKDVIPMLGYIEMPSGEIVGLWRLAKPLDKLIEGKKILMHDRCWWERDEKLCRESFKIIIDNLGLINNIDKMIATIKKYSLQDIDPQNLGVIDNHLVFLDLGYRTEDYN